MNPELKKLHDECNRLRAINHEKSENERTYRLLLKNARDALKMTMKDHYPAVEGGDPAHVRISVILILQWIDALERVVGK